MKRYCNIDDITDGREYGMNDMVRIGCNECRGCHKCCIGMGDTIVMDPYDIYNICTNMECSFESLIGNRIELGVEEGIILPHMLLKNDRCSFLNEEGRCSIHEFRPGVCRLFPLGRYYKDESFTYVLQKDECDYPNKSKVKIKKWIGIENIKEYSEYVCKWHYFIKQCEDIIKKLNDEDVKSMNMQLLNWFYIKEYASGEFFKDFMQRVNRMDMILSGIN